MCWNCLLLTVLLIKIWLIYLRRKLVENIGLTWALNRKKTTLFSLRFHLDEAQLRLLTSKKSNTISVYDRQESWRALGDVLLQSGHLHPGPPPPSMLCHRVPLCQSEDCKSASFEEPGVFEMAKKKQKTKKAVTGILISRAWHDKGCDGEVEAGWIGAVLGPEEDAEVCRTPTTTTTSLCYPSVLAKLHADWCLTSSPRFLAEIQAVCPRGPGTKPVTFLLLHLEYKHR